MGKDPGGIHSYAMLVSNFGGIMAVPMDHPSCLVYPAIYSDDIATKNQNHFNTMGSPPGLRTRTCICHASLQDTDLTEAHKWKYNGSCLIVPMVLNIRLCSLRSTCHVITGNHSSTTAVGNPTPWSQLDTSA